MNSLMSWIQEFLRELEDLFKRMLIRMFYQYYDVSLANQEFFSVLDEISFKFQLRIWFHLIWAIWLVEILVGGTIRSFLWRISYNNCGEYHTTISQSIHKWGGSYTLNHTLVGEVSHKITDLSATHKSCAPEYECGIDVPGSEVFLRLSMKRRSSTSSQAKHRCPPRPGSSGIGFWRWAGEEYSIASCSR